MPKGNRTDAAEVEPELRTSRDDADAQLLDRISKGDDISNRVVNTENEVDAIENDASAWHDYNLEMLTRMFTTGKYAEDYELFSSASLRVGRPSFGERVQRAQKSTTERTNRLRSLRGRIALIPVSSAAAYVASPGSRSPKAAAPTNKVFVVHGHDDGARQSVARFIDRLGIEPIILHEQVSGGRTIVEKLEHYSDVDFAVVLLTPDDIGGPAGSSTAELKPRARQNVILELGFFAGKLGRGKVCALYKDVVEIPSDYAGVVYLTLDSGEGWHLKLAKELRAAGFAIDMNKI